MPARSMPWCAVKIGRRSSAGMNATGRFSRLLLVDEVRDRPVERAGDLEQRGDRRHHAADRSILWMAAADTSARSASCCSDSPRWTRSSRSFGPIELTISLEPAGPVRAVVGTVVDGRRRVGGISGGRSSDVARLTAGHARPS